VKELEEIKERFSSECIQFQVEFKMYKDSIEERKLNIESLKKENNKLTQIINNKDNESQRTKDLLQLHIKKLKEENKALKIIGENIINRTQDDDTIIELYSDLTNNYNKTIGIYKEECNRLRSELIQSKTEVAELTNEYNINKQVLDLLIETIKQTLGIEDENYIEICGALKCIGYYMKDLENVKLVLELRVKEKEAENCKQSILLEERKSELKYYKNLLHINEEQVKELIKEISVDKYSPIIESLKREFQELEHKNQSNFEDKIERQKEYYEKLIQEKVREVEEESHTKLEKQERLNDNRLEELKQLYEKKIEETQRAIKEKMLRETLEMQNKDFEALREKLLKDYNNASVRDESRVEITEIKKNAARREKQLVTEHNKTVKSLEECILTLESRIKSLEGDYNNHLKVYNQEVDNLRNENDSLKEHIMKLKQEINKLESIRDKLLYQINNDKMQSTKQIEYLNNEIIRLKEAGVKEQDEDVIESQGNKIKDLENQIQVIEDENDKLLIRCRDNELLTSQLKEAKEKVKKYEITIKDYEMLNEELNKKMIDLESQLNKMKEEILTSDIKDQYKEKVEECKQLNVENDMLREQVKKVLTEKKGMEQSASEYEDYIKGMKRRNADAAKEIETKSEDIKKLQEQLLESQRNIQYLEELNSKFKQSFESHKISPVLLFNLQAKLKMLKEVLFELKSKYFAHSKGLKEYILNIDSLPELILKRENEIKALQVKLKAEEAVNDNYNIMNRKVMEDFQAYVNEFADKVNKLESYVAGTNIDVEEMQRKLKKYESIKDQHINQIKAARENLELESTIDLDIITKERARPTDILIDESSEKPTPIEDLKETIEIKIDKKEKKEQEDPNEDLEKKQPNTNWIATIFLTEKDLNKLSET